MSAKVKGGTWHHYFAYNCDGSDANGEYFEFAGTAYATCDTALRNAVEWMVEHDYNKGTIFALDIVKKNNSLSYAKEQDVELIFDEGPTPSFIESDDESSLIPWSELEEYGDYRYNTPSELVIDSKHLEEVKLLCNKDKTDDILSKLIPKDKGGK